MISDPYLSLHKAVIAFVPGADAELCEAIILPLRIRVAHSYPDIAQKQPDMIDAAVHSALLDYLREPKRFDPTRSALLTYLTMVAHGDLLNALQQEKRHTRHNVQLFEPHNAENHVSVEDFAGNEDVENAVIAQLDAARVWQAVTRVFPDPQDQQLLDLLLNREREAAPYAAILGISDLPPAAQHKVVNQHKNRLRMRLRRTLAQIVPEEENP